MDVLLKYGQLASEILPGLYQGPQPFEGSVLRDEGFDALVLCALEIQPPDLTFPGVEVLRCPFTDEIATPSPKYLKRIHEMSAKVAQLVREGKKVVVTCHAGVNRSGLVTALAVMELTDCSGKEAITTIRKARPFALTNPAFRSYLGSLPMLP
jgi:protein-tyrosine phosphatase